MKEKRMSRCVVIHLENAIERLPTIQLIRNTMIHNLEVYPAKDGTEWEKMDKIKKIHPRDKTPVSRGVLGCAHSHVDVIRGSLKAKEEATFIFEDDCEMTVSQDTVYEFLFSASKLPKTYDILLLGANEYVETTPYTTKYTEVNRFWGTHAMVLTSRAMRAALQVFADAQKKGEFLPADWMYNEAIKQHGLVCYAPTKIDLLCRQKPGLISAITGKPRELPKDDTAKGPATTATAPPVTLPPKSYAPPT